jgi:hypothetical protein
MRQTKIFVNSAKYTQMICKENVTHIPSVNFHWTFLALFKKNPETMIGGWMKQRFMK